MDYFKENKCRKCKKVFCCKKCRLKHEETVHNVNPDCDICFNGKSYLRDFPESLLNHLKMCHWPLHCVNCKRMFGSINELVLQNKCPVVRKIDSHSSINTPITPNVFLESSGRNSSNYNSPPIMYPFGTNISGNALFSNINNFLFVTTSTPVASGEENLLEKMSQSITPVDTNKTSNVEKSSKTNSKLQPVEPLKDQSMQRKVTFSDTPLIETSIKTNKKCLIGQTNPTERIHSQKFSNSDQESFDIKPEIANSQSDTRSSPAERDNVINETKISTPRVDTTLWQSASCETPIESKLILSSVQSVENSQEFTQSNVSTNFEFTDASNKITFDDTNLKDDNTNRTNKSKGIWSSVANLVKSMVQGLSGSAGSLNEDPMEYTNHTKVHKSLKRARIDSDNSDEIKRLKKIKLTDVKCRRPINCTMPYQRSTKKRKCCCGRCSLKGFFPGWSSIITIMLPTILVVCTVFRGEEAGHVTSETFIIEGHDKIRKKFYQ